MTQPLCGHELGQDWLDPGTLALRRSAAPRNRTEIPKPRRSKMAFTMAYRDKEGSFEKAALTWSDENLGATPRVHVTFLTIEDLFNVFFQMAAYAEKTNVEFSRGAMFLHSSPFGETPPEGSRGLHAAPNRPKTLAEYRRLEELGLNIDTAGPAVLQRLTRLPWAERADLYVCGCLSGGTPGNPGSIAEVLAKVQGVRTVGETGKAYFSRNPKRLVEIGPEDRRVYLRAFHTAKNILIAGSEGELGGVAEFHEAMPQRRFEP